MFDVNQLQYFNEFIPKFEYLLNHQTLIKFL